MKPGAPIFLAQLALGATIIFCIGCGGPEIPEILPVSGVVKINGKPLPNAALRFVPMADGLDSGYVASGTTNKEGEFSLRLQGKEEIGCCACLCKVTIDDPPVPEEVRTAYGAGNQTLVGRYKKSLKNRPIPAAYKLLRTTPLQKEISAEESELNIEIKR